MGLKFGGSIKIALTLLVISVLLTAVFLTAGRTSLPSLFDEQPLQITQQSPALQQPANTTTPTTQPTLAVAAAARSDQPIPITGAQAATQAQSPTPTVVVATPTPTHQPTPLPAERWKEWPVLPVSISEEMRRVYQRGLEQGNNPHAFSILGDCQSEPDVFLGLFDKDPNAVQALPGPLRETVAQFAGSFNRLSPTVLGGTTAGAILWAAWNQNPEKKCDRFETPIDCELRVHKPSIVFIHIGTHWEARNQRYLTIILDKIIAHGAVPVLVTKADNRELDERVNRDYAALALQYDIPLWNFWASVQQLPGQGMVSGSDMYLTDEGLAVHRLGALQTLDTVWRAAR